MREQGRGKGHEGFDVDGLLFVDLLRGCDYFEAILCHFEVRINSLWITLGYRGTTLGSLWCHFGGHFGRMKVILGHFDVICGT